MREHITLEPTPIGKVVIVIFGVLLILFGIVMVAPNVMNCVKKKPPIVPTDDEDWLLDTPFEEV